MKNEIKVNNTNNIQIKINQPEDWSVLDAPLLIYNKEFRITSRIST